MISCRYHHLIPILFCYFLLQTLCFQEGGTVGEVALGWSSTPDVLVNTHPNTLDTGVDWGPFRARETRPTEQLIIGKWAIPITVNSYTSSIPDWPSGLLWSITHSPTALQIFHIVLGGGLIALCFLLFHGATALGMCALLCCDWNFLFYKQLLGGTEICLQLATIGLLWVLMKKKSWGWFIFFSCLGIQAKLTFAFVLAPTILIKLLFRISLSYKHLFRGIAGGTLLLLPLILSSIHHLQIDSLVESHDGFSMQWKRIEYALTKGGSSSALREQSINLWAWMIDPLSFYERIYNIADDSTSITEWIRILGWIVCGGLLFKRRKDPELKLCTALLSTQVLFIILGPKDLHHFAMILPTWALWGGILVSKTPRDIVWLTPFFISTAFFCAQTDSTFKQITIPTFSASQQQRLYSTLDDHNVQKLVTMDYEIYGLLEYHRPQIQTIHGWAAISHKRYHALPQLIEEANGGHILVVESSMPMRYNLHPTEKMLSEAAQKKGLQYEVLEKESNWILARIYNSAKESF